MAYKKLSEKEKQEILVELQQDTASISDLATRHGVSQTTIRRLKAEAEVAVSGSNSSAADSVPGLVPCSVPDLEADSNPDANLDANLDVNLDAELAGRRLRRRSSAQNSADPADTSNSETASLGVDFGAELAELEKAEPVVSPPIQTWVSPVAGPILKKKADPIAAEDGDDLEEELDADDLDEDDEELEDIDDLDEDEDEDELGDDLGDDAAAAFSVHVEADGSVSILPLAEATWPRMCYLVVDRSAELITRPLQEFGDLGQIPTTEELARTLPVFENHRVAKRFANPRTQRVIKLPDAKMLQKASPHLQAKGITRLLINGQVYSL